MVVSRLHILTLNNTLNFNDKPTEVSSDLEPPPSPSATSSTATISSLSTSSLPLTTLLPTPLQQTVHITTCEGEPSLALQVRSRAPSANNTPTYHGGDVITGNVVLNVTPKEAQYVTLVEIELQGEVVLKSKTQYRFLTKRSTLWTSSTSANSSVTALVSPQANRVEKAGVKDIGSPRKAQLSSTSPGQPCRSLNIPCESFRSTLQSMGRSIGRERGVEEPSHTVISTQINKSRSRLEPSCTHVWPFEFSIPTHVSSSSTTSSRAPDSSSTTPRYLILHPGNFGGDETEETEEKGGVRSEQMGYGVCCDVTDGIGLFQHAENAMHQKQKDLTEQTLSDGISHRIIFDNGEKLSQPSIRPTVITSGSEQRTYMLPPSFSESSCVAYLDYKLIVTVHKRGALRGDKCFQAKLNIPDYSSPGPSTGLSLPKTHPDVVALRLPAPSENPDGWSLMPEVTMQLQPTIRQSVGAINNGTTKDIVFKLALSRPLCYARGTTIPFRITISIPHPNVPASQDKQVLSSAKKYKKFSAQASHASTISGPPVALGIAPLFRKSHSMSPLTSGTLLSHVGTEAPSRLLPKTGAAVPSGKAIASSVRLVRAIHVGPDANDNSKINRECTSFSHIVSTAIIQDDEPVGQNVTDDSEETACDIKGWATKQERLVRTFIGEIPLKKDIKPSFVFSHFVLQYAVVLFPFEVSGFTPSSSEPLWSEPVTIAAQPAVSGSVPTLVSEDQPVIDKVDRDIYTRYFATSNQ